jgi:hypothetical protein
MLHLRPANPANEARKTLPRRTLKRTLKRARQSLAKAETTKRIKIMSS